MVPLRVAILTPTAPPAVTGNAITVERIRRGLTARSVDARVWDLSVAPADDIERAIAAFAPALVHAFHAFRAGPLGARVAGRLGRPLVVTVTGTDANRDLDDPERGGRVRRALEAAAGITVFHEVMTARVASALADGAARVSVVPQSVVFEPGPPPCSRAADADGPVVLFPAGIRAIKQPRFPLVPLER